VRRNSLATVAALAAAGSYPAQAARPMITDDARVVDARSCQVETWMRHNEDSTEYWALPACNPWGNLEITFGGARTHDAEGDAFTDHVLQAKTVLKRLESGWGAALTLGTNRRAHRESANGWPGDAYVNVPFSVPVKGDAWIAHVNVGAQHRRDEGRTLATWGFGNEVRLRDDLYFIPEIFRNEHGRPFYQLGVRYWAVKGVLQVDATFGNRAVSDADEHWVSIGLRILTPAFLP